MPRDLRVPVRDGKFLAADLHEGAGEGPWPVILIQTPYGKDRLAAAMPHSSARSWLDFWDREHYALVVSDWRGYHASAEAGEGGRPPHRGTDGYDLVEWIAAAPFCDGRVATLGPSALGRAQLRTAAEAPISLICAVPLVCHMGHFYEDFYEGGVLQEAHARAVDALGFSLTGDILANPLPGSEFWRAGAAESRPEALDLPLLFVTGWYDLVTAQTLRFYAEVRAGGGPRARAFSRLLIGPWHHTAIDQARQGDVRFPAAAGAAGEETKRFLDHHVRRIRPHGDDLPALVRWFQMGEDRWLTAPRWPPAGRSEVTLHLHADGALRPEAPRGESERRFVSDPEKPVPTLGGANLPLGLRAGPCDQRPLEARDDVVIYTSEALGAPVRLCGGATATLTAVADRLDADLAVRLTDVTPEGKSLLVADSIARASLRAGTGRPAPLVPGVPFEATVHLPPVGHTFLPGHRIRILVAGSNWPRFERNSHTGAGRHVPGESLPAEVGLRHGGDARSCLVLPVLGPGA